MCCMRRTWAWAGARIVAAAVVQPKAASSEAEAWLRTTSMARRMAMPAISDGPIPSQVDR